MVVGLNSQDISRFCITCYSVELLCAFDVREKKRKNKQRCSVRGNIICSKFLHSLKSPSILVIYSQLFINPMLIKSQKTDTHQKPHSTTLKVNKYILYVIVIPWVTRGISKQYARVPRVQPKG